MDKHSGLLPLYSGSSGISLSVARGKTFQKIRQNSVRIHMLFRDEIAGSGIFTLISFRAYVRAYKHQQEETEDGKGNRRPLARTE